jgi:Macrocin-O-methyltransferase (TylF)
MSTSIFGFDTERAWEYENGFHLTSHVTRLAKILGQYDVYRRIRGLPGDIVEAGVFKGASLIRLATFREVSESPYSRQIIGFDAFGEFPAQSAPGDAAYVERFQQVSGTGIPVDELERVLALKGFRNIELVPGDITRTVPAYLAAHPELRIALLHLDVDVYEPTRQVLESLWDRVVRRGVAMFDDYGKVAGETRAVEEFFADRDVVIEKPPTSHVSAFIVKTSGARPEPADHRDGTSREGGSDPGAHADTAP